MRDSLISAIFARRAVISIERNIKRPNPLKILSQKNKRDGSKQANKLLVENSCNFISRGWPAHFFFMPELFRILIFPDNPHRRLKNVLIYDIKSKLYLLVFTLVVSTLCIGLFQKSGKVPRIPIVSRGIRTKQLFMASVR